MVMKVYSPEFKADAVALFHSEPDLTIAQTARDLGINAETLRNWIRADRVRGGSTTGMTRKKMTSTAPASEASREELEARVQALEAELKAPARRTPPSPPSGTSCARRQSFSPRR
jgi:transposase